jgi:prephenate dehydratase
MDALFNEKVFIVGELQLPIHHNLAVLSGVSAKDIRGVMSHPQALNQCRAILKKHYPNAEWITAPSTAAGFEYIHKHLDRSLAAIGTEAAAKHWGLKIATRGIENDHDNFTRFVVVRAKPNAEPRRVRTQESVGWVSPDSHGYHATKAPTKGAKTSLIFYFSKNRPGSLFNVFQVFADLKINLSRIESRPAPKKLGEYLFYLDFDESGASTKGKQALQKVMSMVDGLKILGSY